jgi:30S ribosomal protein S31
MGKGDIKTRRGKLFAGSFGKKRKKGKKQKLSQASIPPVKKEVSPPSVKEKKAATIPKATVDIEDKKVNSPEKTKAEVKAPKEAPEKKKELKSSKAEKKD